MSWPVASTFLWRPRRLAFASLFCLLAREAAPQNLVTNGDFDQTQMLDTWFSPGVAWTLTPDHTGTAGSGSAQLSVATGEMDALYQCVPTSVGTEYSVAFYSNVSSSSVSATLAGAVSFFTDQNCTMNQGPYSYFVFDTSNVDTWLAGTGGATATGSSALIIFSLVGSPSSATVFIDDVSMTCVDVAAPAVTPPSGVTVTQTTCQ